MSASVYLGTMRVISGNKHRLRKPFLKDSEACLIRQGPREEAKVELELDESGWIEHFNCL